MARGKPTHRDLAALTLSLCLPLKLAHRLRLEAVGVGGHAAGGTKQGRGCERGGREASGGSSSEGYQAQAAAMSSHTSPRRPAHPPQPLRAHPSNTRRLVASPTLSTASRMCSGVMKDMLMRRDSISAVSKIFLASRLRTKHTHSHGSSRARWEEATCATESCQRDASDQGKGCCVRCGVGCAPSAVRTPEGQVLGRLPQAPANHILYIRTSALYLHNHGGAASGHRCVYGGVRSSCAGPPIRRSQLFDANRRRSY